VLVLDGVLDLAPSTLIRRRKLAYNQCPCMEYKYAPRVGSVGPAKPPSTPWLSHVRSWLLLIVLLCYGLLCVFFITLFAMVLLFAPLFVSMLSLNTRQLC
jgi:hypothetical protein